jgi:hypothetical protein
MFRFYCLAFRREYNLFKAETAPVFRCQVRVEPTQLGLSERINIHHQSSATYSDSPLERGTSVCSHLLMLVPSSRIFLPWRWSRYVPPKRRFTQDLHGFTFQKTAFIKILWLEILNLLRSCSVSFNSVIVSILSVSCFQLLYIFCVTTVNFPVSTNVSWCSAV